jgi:hypothetical protein
MPERYTKNQPRGIINKFPIYPLPVGIFSILALAASNLAEADLSLTYRSGMLSLAFAALLFGLLSLALRDRFRAAGLAAFLLILFFSYGHAYNLLTGAHILQAAVQGHLILLGTWAVLAGTGGWLILRKAAGLAALTPALNMLSLLLLVYPLFQIGRFEIKNAAQERSVHAETGDTAARPDIYYIILDAYDRADMLKVVYDYDNTAFLEALGQRGFYIAACSQSNYAYTQPSLASSLNLDYLDSLGVTSNEQADSLLKANAARQFLEGQGYTVVAFETGFRWSQWEEADVYYRYRPDAGTLNGFEALFLQTTLLRPLLDRQYASLEAAHGVLPYERVLYVLDALKNVPLAVKGPKFVFVHLTIPHPPFVFGPEGQFVTAGSENATSVSGYRNAVTFINRQILQVVDSVIEASATPPIIVIQGDHGAPRYQTPEERMAILNAYYLPGGEGELYASISPVNTFRVIFNTFFGGRYSLLQDTSWYSAPNRIYEFGEIANECREK